MGTRKQRHFGRLLEDRSGHYDKAAGTLAFPPGPTYKVQVLGSELAETDSWQWAWANTDSPFPAEQLQAAQRLRSLGEQWGIEEWTTPRIPRQQLSAHLLGPVAMGVLDLPAYYRYMMVETNLLFVISDPTFGPLSGLSGTEFVATLGDAISNCLIPNHFEAVQKFIEQLGWPPTLGRDSVLQVTADDGVLVLATFDDLQRLAKLSTRLVATA